MIRTACFVVLLALAVADGCQPSDDDDDTTAAITDDDDTTPVPDDDDTADDDDVVDDDDATECEPEDADGDGYLDAACGRDDCVDSNPDVHPGAIEVCANGLDDDCDGACIGCGLCGEHPLALADAKLLGEFVSAGSWVAPAGDVDHDGFDDIMVASSRQWTVDPYKVYIVTGPQYGTSSLSEASVQLESWSLEAETIYPGTVTSGDFNGDGERDFAVGECQYAIVYGPQSGIVDMADHTFLGEPPNGGGGCSVASAGDVDGDGVDDLLVGDSSQGVGGGARLYSGPIASSPDGAGFVATLVGSGANLHAGHTVAGGGDINNDGYDDLVIADIGHDGMGDEAGAVHVVYGPVTGEHSLADADATLLGTACGWVDTGSGDWYTADSKFGYSIAVDDMNLDGFDDVIVGAPGAGPVGAGGKCDPGATGMVSVFHGPLSGVVNVEEADASVALISSAMSVASAGDVNGDGVPDLLIGARHAPPAGGAYLLYGPLADGVLVTEADVKIVGENPEFGARAAGTSVTGGGDINNDGYDDIVIGDPSDDEAGDLAGAAYILYGGPGY